MATHQTIPHPDEFIPDDPFTTEFDFGLIDEMTDALAEDEIREANDEMDGRWDPQESLERRRR